jgi:hypothetical protein
VSANINLKYYFNLIRQRWRCNLRCREGVGGDQGKAMLARATARFWVAAWMAKPFFIELIRCFPGNRNATLFCSPTQVLLELFG